jgi:hypothetical protein
MAACPLLDDLFNWAAQQGTADEIFVGCYLATNQSAFQGRDENMVTYATGALFYDRGGWQGEGRFGRFVPAAFTGSLTQFFSNKTFNIPSSTAGYEICPFNPEATENLQITISSPPLFPAGGPYSVWINSPEWGSPQSFTPQCTPGVIYGMASDAILLVISLSAPDVVPAGG